MGGVSWAFLMGLKWRISESIELLLSSLSHLGGGGEEREEEK